MVKLSFRIITLFLAYATLKTKTTCNGLSILSKAIGRRNLLSKSTILAIGGSSGLLFPSSRSAAATTSGPQTSFVSYKIQPDGSETLSPTINSVTPLDLVEKVFCQIGRNNGGALWLGEHHNSVQDHQLQAFLVRDIYEKRKKSSKGNIGPMSIGLEQVQKQFQPVLDAYVAGKISAEEMREKVEWEKRWNWSFEGYLPIFEVAQKFRIPLIALNVDSEDLSLVEMGGFPNLPRDRMQRYISDLPGFAEFAARSSYKTYVDYVISPSYDMHKQLGILKTTISGQRLDDDMPFSRFLSGRILWDEGMASTAYAWTKENPGGLMIGLVGADHVKFEDGITGRYQRMAQGNQDCVSVILNPTLIDTRPSGSVNMATNNAFSGADQITLQLRYLKKGVDPASPERGLPESTGGVLALADYIMISST